MKKQILFLKIADENGVFVVDSENIDETYGHTMENILKNTMQLENIRNERMM